jgi:hypothetical protein
MSGGKIFHQRIASLVADSDSDENWIFEMKTIPYIRQFIGSRGTLCAASHAGFGADAKAALRADNDKANSGQALLPDRKADPSIVEVNDTSYCYATTHGWWQGL